MRNGIGNVAATAWQTLKRLVLEDTGGLANPSGALSTRIADTVVRIGE